MGSEWNSAEDTRHLHKQNHIQNKTRAYTNFAYHQYYTETPRFFILQTARLGIIGEDVVDEYRCVAVLSSDCVMLTSQ